MFSTNVCSCIKVNLRKKLDLQGTAGGYALTVHKDWQQFLKVTCINHCDLVCVELSYLPDRHCTRVQLQRMLLPAEPYCC